MRLVDTSTQSRNREFNANNPVAEDGERNSDKGSICTKSTVAGDLCVAALSPALEAILEAGVRSHCCNFTRISFMRSIRVGPPLERTSQLNRGTNSGSSQCRAFSFGSLFAARTALRNCRNPNGDGIAELEQ